MDPKLLEDSIRRYGILATNLPFDIETFKEIEKKEQQKEAEAQQKELTQETDHEEPSEDKENVAPENNEDKENTTPAMAGEKSVTPLKALPMPEGMF